MSKSIYEETFNHLDELVDVLAHIEGSFLYRHYLDNIRLKLKKAQKQEKLYKRLFNVCKEYKCASIGLSDDSEFLNVMSKLEEELK